MNRNRIIAILLLALSLGAAGDQALAQQSISQSNDANSSARSSDETQLSKLLAQARPRRRPFFIFMPESGNASLAGPMFSIRPVAAPALPVTGTGTIGRLTKWSAFNASNSVVGDSTIYEDKFGKVGVGTDSPGSKLTVAGMIEAKGADGGIKFPDGTIQTTSASGALRGVAHDQTLMGSGTSASPLGVASPLLVRDFDNPARQPVRFTKFPGDEPFTVPAGKRLVIEFVSGFVHVIDGDELRDRKAFAITFRDSGDRSISTLHFVLGDVTEVQLGGRVYTISQLVRLYANPGTEVQVFPSSTITAALLTVSGYYVDVGGDATPVSSRLK